MGLAHRHAEPDRKLSRVDDMDLDRATVCSTETMISISLLAVAACWCVREVLSIIWDADWALFANLGSS
jgi:hypothetical protein